jgi:hypothetical protein
MLDRARQRHLNTIKDKQQKEHFERVRQSFSACRSSTMSPCINVEVYLPDVQRETPRTC